MKQLPGIALTQLIGQPLNGNQHTPINRPTGRQRWDDCCAARPPRTPGQL